MSCCGDCLSTPRRLNLFDAMLAPRIRRLVLWCLFGVVVVAGLWSLIWRSIARSAKESYNRGRSHFDAGEYDQAIVLFTEAIRADPKHPEARHYRGWAYERK